MFGREVSLIDWVRMVQRLTHRWRCSLVADDDVAVLGSLGDHGVLAARRARRLCVDEAHQSEVDSLSRLRHDHPRTGDRRADAERPWRVAGDDAWPPAGHWVDARVSGVHVSSSMTCSTAAAAAAAVATAGDGVRYQHCNHTSTNCEWWLQRNTSSL